ncbi:hypothetical protein DB346_13575 [Verrucomicrobia bacterium LW23]|nr:hypothetical protein DB346_13575 [Verrucomicrobia bacterium LW23]
MYPPFIPTLARFGALFAVCTAALLRPSPAFARARRVFACVLGLLAFVGATAQAGTVLPLNTRTDSGTTLKVEQLFTDLPPMGFAPLRVTVKNNTGYTQSWQLTSSHSYQYYGDGRGIRGAFNMTVESGREGEFLLLAPLMPRADSNALYAHNTLSLTLTGYGVDNGTASWVNGGRPGWNAKMGGSTPTRRAELPYILISHKLLPSGWSDLGQAMPNVDGGEVSVPADWPTDPRAYMGVSAVFIPRDEWLKIRPEQRMALQQWVMQGGRLRICWPQASEAALAPLLNNRTAPGSWGAGSIAAMATRMKEAEAGKDPEESLAPKDVERVISARLDPRYLGQERINFFDSGHNNDDTGGRAIQAEVAKYIKFGPSEGMEPPDVPRGLIMLFVLGFSVLVGPINLFYFAPVSKRYRLFWTTPLISVGASVFLMMLIVLSEGFGGAGNRVAVTLLMGEDRKSLTVQEQASRTAVLFSPNFNLATPGAVQPVKLSRSDDSDADPYGGRRSRNSDNTGGGTYFVNGNAFSGSWFSGRNMQAQWLQVMDDTREQVTLMNPPENAAGEAPVLLSSAKATLDKVFFRDRAGKVWECDGLSSGSRKTCKPSTEKALSNFLGEARDKFGRRLRNLVDTVDGNRGWLFASVAPGHQQMVDTLTSIRWTSDSQYIMGQVTGAAPAPGEVSVQDADRQIRQRSGSDAGAQEGNQ